MSQDVTFRKVCEVFKNYSLDSRDPEVLKWYYRLKARDEETIANLHEYLARKVFNHNKSKDTLKTVKPSPETEHKESQT